RLSRVEEELAGLRADRDQLMQLWSEQRTAQTNAQSLRKTLEEVTSERERLEQTLPTVVEYDARERMYARVGELTAFERETRARLESAISDLERVPHEDTLIREEVVSADVAAVVERWTGIPVQRLLGSEQTKLVELEARLTERVKGQEAAVNAVARAVRRARAGLSNPTQPIASFLFVGPTGVGKTELSKALAEQLFDDERAMIRLDMSEYMEAHSVSRLIGAPPGYIGHEDGGQLTEAVRRRGYCVVLLDEVEKAHPEVFNVLLQVLDDGRLTDSQGRTIDFRNALIIMTSNLGTSADGDSDPGAVLEAVRSHFRPEFVNRIDEVIVFDTLEDEQLKAIVRVLLNELEERLRSHNVGLEITEEAIGALVSLGHDRAFGARPLRRALQRHVEDPLSMALVTGELSPDMDVNVSANAHGSLVFAYRARTPTS
ncbi:MAG: AAA family ATPase, partial [Bradymonadia bacterium]